MIPSEWLTAAFDRISPLIQRTPLEYDKKLDIYLKWENRQVTGSFKIRGALNKVLTLQPWEQARGLVAASAGNHGQGVAYAARLVKAQAVVFASQHAVDSKVAAMRQLGAEVRLVPGGYAEAEEAGIRFAHDQGMTWVSPYNDGQVIAGQATLGIEILQQLGRQQVDTIICPAGGGGLASGVGQALQVFDNPVKLAVVQSDASPYLFHLFTHGSQAGIEELPSLADGLAGAVETGSITIPLVNQVVDHFVLVSEEEIARAIVYAWRNYGQIVEGAAATALAAALWKPELAKPAVVIVSGGNIQPDTHRFLLEKYALDDNMVQYP